MTDSSRGYQQFFAECKRRRVLLALVGAVLLFGGCWMGRQGTPGAARSYQAARTAEAPTIDGRLDEIAWADASTTESFVDIQGENHPDPTWTTRARILWDDTHLYVGAWLEEPHLLIWLDAMRREP